MIAFFLGSIPMGSDSLTSPTGQNLTRKNTFAQHDVTRGKPVLQDIGSELDTQDFDFFFSEEFCDPQAELKKLELAFALKTPLPLKITGGAFSVRRFVVQSLRINVRKTNRSGRIVRVEATLSLIEAPITNLRALLQSMALAAAPALARVAGGNPNVRR
ncbi:MAG: phage tail protein [Marinovum sp.]|nr:phage tail protein [Marinovum sp.]